MNRTGQAELGSGKWHMSRTKSRFKPGQTNRKGEERGQVAFNDPLYEYLDNEVYNRQQHNFGPWIQMERRSRERTRTRERRPNIVDQVILPEQLQEEEQMTLSPVMSVANQELVLPSIRERGVRAQSLQELRAVSLELRAPRGQQRLRHQPILGRQPFFKRGQGTRLGEFGSEKLLGRRSNFIYNYCFRDDEKVLAQKLRVKVDTPYLKLQPPKICHVANSKNANEDLIRELREYRLSKMK